VVTTDRRGGGGEYPTQDGFGWTNSVMRKRTALYPADADLASVDVSRSAKAAKRRWRFQSDQPTTALDS
jgi:alpha,alpha-trehalase